MKFKNIKKKPAKRKAISLKETSRKNKIIKPESKHGFPSFYRFIPEIKHLTNLVRIKFSSLRQGNLLKIIPYLINIILILILISGIIYFSINTYQNLNKYFNVTAKKAEIQSKINFWQSIADKYEGYKDAYFMIAELSYELGDFEKAKINNKKALMLDPDFDQAKKLDQLLNKK